MLKSMIRLIPVLIIAALLASCSGPGGCYSPADRTAALNNGMLYWEDIIALFPQYFGEWQIDRFVVSKKTMADNPPARTFYDADGNPIEWDQPTAPAKFGGYSVEVNYWKNYQPGTSEIPLTLILYFSRPVTRSLRAELIGHENGERLRINRLDLNRGDPKSGGRAVAFYNNDVCIECVLPDHSPDAYYDAFKYFLDRIDMYEMANYIEGFYIQRDQ
jgi:hypothetical protein